MRDWRPTWRLNNTDPVASNFYPVTAAIEIAQPDKSALAVLTDRAQGELSFSWTGLSVLAQQVVCESAQMAAALRWPLRPYSQHTHQ